MHRLRACRLVAGLILAGLPVVSPAARVRVIADRVNLRARDSDAVEVVGQVMAGQELEAPDGLDGAWIRVVPPDEVSLWIYAELVRDGQVAVSKAQVRAGPGIQYKTVGQLDKGAAVEVRGRLGDWLKLRPPPGTSLWVSRDYVEALAVPVDPAAAAPPAGETVPATPPSPDAPPAEPAAPTPLPPPPGPRAGLLPAQPPPPADCPALAHAVLDPNRPQGLRAAFVGRVATPRTPALPGSPLPRFVLVQPDVRGRSRMVCRLVGHEPFLPPLLGATVRATGRVWYPAGADAPVLQAERLVRLSDPAEDEALP